MLYVKIVLENLILIIIKLYVFLINFVIWGICCIWSWRITVWGSWMAVWRSWGWFSMWMLMAIVLRRYRNGLIIGKDWVLSMRVWILLLDCLMIYFNVLNLYNLTVISKCLINRLCLSMRFCVKESLHKIMKQNDDNKQ